MLNKTPLKPTKVLNWWLLKRLRLLPAEVYDSDGYCSFDHLTITKRYYVKAGEVYHCCYRDAARGLDFLIFAFTDHGVVSRHDRGKADVLSIAKCYGLVTQYLPRRKGAKSD